MSTKPGPTPEEHPGFRLFPEERKFVAENRDQLVSDYGDRFVAILDSAILDSDKDFSALAERVYDRFGYRRIFMPFVRQAGRVYRMRSPRVLE